MSHTAEKSDKSEDKTTRQKPSIFSVSSLLADEKSDRRDDRLSDDKEEDEITLPPTFQHQAFGKPPFLYPGKLLLFVELTCG